MEWRNLAWKNIWHNLRRYLSYLLASTMAVMVFSLFFIFIFNPHVYTLAAAQIVAVILVICVFIVAWFAIFFIFYFHSTLIRTRNKEFGLLMTLGMTPRQIARLIFLESICIGFTALVLGIILGVLGSQPFLWAMGAILELPDTIPFELSPFAVLVTAIFFGGVFLLEALIISWRIRRRTPRTLLLGARVRQISAKASPVKVVLGLLCIAASYIMAIVFSASFVLNAIPIVLLAMLGTFFIFGEFLVMLLNALRKRTLSGVNLLIVARLAHRLKDYARMLSIVTILSACVLTGMGSVYGFLRTLQGVYEQIQPVKLQLAENLDKPFKANSQQMYTALRNKHLSFLEQFETQAITGQTNATPITIISTASYERLRSALVHIRPEQENVLPHLTVTGQSYLLLPPPDPVHHGERQETIPLAANSTLTIEVASTHISTQVTREHIRIFNQGGTLPENTLVVSDQQFAQLQKQALRTNQWRVYNMHGSTQQQSYQAAITLEKLLNIEGQRDLRSTISTIQATQLFSTLLFAGMFVSALFLFSGASALYFKLFTQQEDDRRQFYALARVGLRKREGVRIIASEFFLLFFLPVLIAVLHSSVASIDLINLMQANAYVQQTIGLALAIIIGLYAACFALYYLVALVNYFRRVRVATF